MLQLAHAKVAQPKPAAFRSAIGFETPSGMNARRPNSSIQINNWFNLQNLYEIPKMIR